VVTRFVITLRKAAGARGNCETFDAAGIESFFIARLIARAILRFGGKNRT